MLPTRRIEAELNLPDAGVRLLTSRWPLDLDFTFSAEQHLFAMYLSSTAQAEGRYRESGERYSPIGALFFRPARLQLNIRGVGGHQARAVHCLVDDRRLRALAPEGLDWTGDQLRAALDIHAGSLKSCFQRLLAELRSPGFASATVADAALVLMISDLFDYLAARQADNAPAGSMSDRMMRRVRERVYDLQAVTPTVGELAQLAGLSERHLLRLFRERLGVSLVEFVRQARLEKANTLLAASDLPLKEIAYRLGFASHASFATAFRRDAGSTPAAFRREHRRTSRAPGVC
jgi:AraC family transcriptional regulator